MTPDLRAEDAEVRMAAANLLAALHNDIAMCGTTANAAYERLARVIHEQGAAASERIGRALASPDPEAGS